MLKHTDIIMEQKRVNALGARWNILAEEAFRKGMEAVLRNILGYVKIEKWRYFDSEDYVRGYPSLIEVDLVIRDGEHML